MNLLQTLLGRKLLEGKSLREISRESGVSHSNLSRYHKTGMEPDSVNLMKLANYFGVEFYELLEQADPNKKGFNMGPTLEDQLAFQEWQQLSPDQKLLAVQMLRKLRAESKTADQSS